MKHYVGLDVSQKEVSVCVVDADRAMIAEGKLPTSPAEIVSWIERRVGAVERIVHESGPLSCGASGSCSCAFPAPHRAAPIVVMPWATHQRPMQSTSVVA